MTRALRARLPVAVLAAGAGWLACAPPAWASIVVRADGPTLRFDVISNAITLGPQRAVVEHFVDGTRAGIRVRQRFPGDPPISSPSSACFNNIVFNDTVCEGSFTKFEIRVLEDVDTSLEIGGSNVACNGPQVTALVNAELGDGDDYMKPWRGCGAGFVGEAQADALLTLRARFVVHAAGGVDQLRGGPLADELDGGGDAGDFIFAGRGDDTLRGASTMLGDSGADTFHAFPTPAPNANEIQINGGAGRDTVRFEGETRPLIIRLDDAQNDGHDGMMNIKDLEVVIAGAGDDTLVALGGDQTLDGAAGDDDLEGGDGADILRGGDGDDVIDARDGVADEISCGQGFDEVVADLVDPVPEPKTGGRIVPRSAITGGGFCERVERFATDDGPPGRVTSRRIAVGAGAGTVALTVACPRTARIACRGEASLGLGRAVLAAATYDVRRGAARRVVLPLSRADATALRRSGAVAVRLREQGVSRKGPRSSRALLGVVRS